MDLLRRIVSDRRLHRWAAVAAVLGAGVLLVAWKLGLDGSALKAGWRAAEDYLAQHPWILFLSLVILPGLPVPTSALLFLAGTVWREQPVMACLLCLAAIGLNMTWTYWLAARAGRRLIERMLAAFSIRIPELPRGDHLRLILILRLTPGMPFFVQNYLLGLFRAPFRLYLVVSLGCNALFASGIVLSGAGIAEGNLTPVLTGLGLIVLGLVVVHTIRQRLARRRAVKTAD
jgi:uncharacterized membrane protein YdjX (TVP38/TMEM64 family)